MSNESLVTFDLEKYAPKQRIVELDIVPFLHMEFVLKEEQFRSKVAEIDWNTLRDKIIAVFCSNDAIIPSWAFMLLVSEAGRHGIRAISGTKDSVYERLFLEQVNAIDFSQFTGKRVLVKGCSHVEVPISLYMETTSRLVPVAKRVMYGESCSFVPVFKGGREEAETVAAS